METEANFRPGFRISEVDVGVVILAILVSVLWVASMACWA